MRSDLSVKNSVQNRNQRLSGGHVRGVNVGGPNCVRGPVPAGRKTGDRILVEDVQDIKVKRQRVIPVITKPVTMCPGKVRLRKGWSPSQIASLDQGN